MEKMTKGLGKMEKMFKKFVKSNPILGWAGIGLFVFVLMLPFNPIIAHIISMTVVIVGLMTAGSI